MKKEELDGYLEHHEYLNRLMEEWEDKKQELIQAWKGQTESLSTHLTNEEQEELINSAIKKLNEVWIGWRSITGASSNQAALDSSRIPEYIQNELNAAMKDNQCNDIRTPNGFYYLTADKDGNNTLYVDSRWLEENYSPHSTPQDYLQDIKNIIGNENFKISDMNGKFKNELVNDFFYKADTEYGVRAESSAPRPTPPSPKL